MHCHRVHCHTVAWKNALDSTERGMGGGRVILGLGTVVYDVRSVTLATIFTPASRSPPHFRILMLSVSMCAHSTTHFSEESLSRGRTRATPSRKEGRG